MKTKETILKEIIESNDYKYYNSKSVAQMKLIKKLYRESFMAARGVDKILKKKGFKINV